MSGTGSFRHREPAVRGAFLAASCIDIGCEAILKVGFSDGIYGRSKGGMTPSGWECDHLPYLVEIDNWGVSRQPGQAGAGGIWVWGYDEITWFGHQSREYRADWLRYAWDWVRRTDPAGFLQMPGSRTMRSPLGRHAIAPRQPSQPGGSRGAGRRGCDSGHLGRRPCRRVG